MFIFQSKIIYKFFFPNDMLLVCSDNKYIRMCVCVRACVGIRKILFHNNKNCEFFILILCELIKQKLKSMADFIFNFGIVDNVLSLVRLSLCVYVCCGCFFAFKRKF